MHVLSNPHNWLDLEEDRGKLIRYIALGTLPVVTPDNVKKAVGFASRLWARSQRIEEYRASIRHHADLALSVDTGVPGSAVLLRAAANDIYKLVTSLATARPGFSISESGSAM